MPSVLYNMGQTFHKHIIQICLLVFQHIFSFQHNIMYPGSLPLSPPFPHNTDVSTITCMNNTEITIVLNLYIHFGGVNVCCHRTTGAIFSFE